MTAFALLPRNFAPWKYRSPRKLYTGEGEARRPKSVNLPKQATEQFSLPAEAFLIIFRYLCSRMPIAFGTFFVRNFIQRYTTFHSFSPPSWSFFSPIFAGFSGYRNYFATFRNFLQLFHNFPYLSQLYTTFYNLFTTFSTPTQANFGLNIFKILLGKS